jgi:hypothetical protein
VTSIVIEQLGVAPGRGGHAIAEAQRRGVEALAGRNVWCVTALPAGPTRRSAEGLRVCLHRVEHGEVSVRWLEVRGGEEVDRLARQIEGMLRGAASAPGELGPDAREVYAGATAQGEDLLGRRIARGDVVVLHDPVATLLTGAVRERGAHAVWHLSPTQAPAARAAWDFLCGSASGTDAYLVSSRHSGRAGRAVDRISALMPSAGVVAQKEVDAARADGHEAGWVSALGEIVDGDRDETVGGTLHPRPSVAAR